MVRRICHDGDASMALHRVSATPFQASPALTPQRQPRPPGLGIIPLNKRLQKMADHDNAADIDLTRKTVNDLEKKGAFTTEQLKQVKDNLTKDKTDTEKGLALLEKLYTKENKKEE